jgi:hypothetical protein
MHSSLTIWIQYKKCSTLNGDRPKRHERAFLRHSFPKAAVDALRRDHLLNSRRSFFKVSNLFRDLLSFIVSSGNGDTIMDVHSYVYEPLNDQQGANQIRLVKLLPSYDFTSDIRCRIFKMSLKDSPPYEALSYT